MASTSSRIDIEKLDSSSNFNLWQQLVYDLLIQQDLSLTLDGPKLDSVTASDWLRLQRKATSTIRSCLSDSALYHVLGENDPAQLWEKLGKRFASKLMMSRLALKRKLFGLRMAEGTDLSAHIDCFNQLITDLRKIEEEFFDENKVIFLLVSLPDSYDHLVTTLLHGSKAPDLEDVITTLMEYYQRKKGAEDNHGEALYVKNGKERGRQKEKGKQGERSRSKSRTNWLKNQTCHKCHQKGHLRRDCPKMKNGKANVYETSTVNVAKAEEGCNRDVFSALIATNEIVDSWILDSGCSYHICPHDDLFHSYSSATGIVSMGNKAPCRVVGVGTVKIRMFDREIRVLGNVRHVPEMGQNLISLGYLEANGCTSKGGNGILKVFRGALVVMKGTRLRGNIYKLEGSTVLGGAAVATSHEPTTDDTLLWHLRLGHMSETGMLKLHTRGLLPGVRSCKLEFCKYCVMGKQCRVTFKTTKHDMGGVIDYIHPDVWGPVDVMSSLFPDLC